MTPKEMNVSAREMLAQLDQDHTREARLAEQTEPRIIIRKVVPRGLSVWIDGRRLRCRGCVIFDNEVQLSLPLSRVSFGPDLTRDEMNDREKENYDRHTETTA